MKTYYLIATLIVLSGKIYSQLAPLCLNKIDSTNTGMYTGNNVRGICIEDFNGDAVSDLVSVANNNVSIQFGLGSGLFSAPTNYTLNALDLSSAVSGDFNSDGYFDLVVVDNPTSTFSVLLGGLNGVFTPTNSITVGMAISNAAVSDLNYDGKVDIIVSDAGSSSIYLFLGNGNAGFNTPVTLGVGQNPLAMTFRDFNNDGPADLLVANNGSNTVSLLLGNGSGGLSLINNFNVGINPIDLVAADFNSDGYMDAAVVNSGSDNITVLLNNGTGSFSSSVSTYTVGMNPRDIELGDFNNDGKLDLATANLSSDNVSVLLGNGLGSFSAATHIPAKYPYLVTGFDYNTNGHDDLLVINIGLASNVMLFSHAAAPLTVSGMSTVCLGTSTTLNVSGSSTYTWSTGAVSPSLAVQPASTTVYSVSSNGTCGISSKSVTVTVNPNCQDVWPGDANSDGLVDNTDVLELGLHFTQTGPPRATTSNTWQSYFANNWTGTISNGKNVNHSDCNGDGVINNNDTLAFFTNYVLAHAFKQPEQIVVNPQLSIVPDQTAVSKGSWGTASVFLGESSVPITNINGLAFTVSFDQNLIETNSFYIEYPASFINTGNQNLDFSKPDFTNGKLYTATTHTITNNVSGNGKIAVLHYKIKSNLATDAVLNISISQAKQCNASGALVPLTAGTASVAAIGASVGMDELSTGNSIGIYPNPANVSVTIQSSTTFEKIELISVTGQVILSEKTSGAQHQLNLTEVANGVYFINIYSADQKVARKKLVVQR